MSGWKVVLVSAGRGGTRLFLSHLSQQDRHKSGKASDNTLSRGVWGSSDHFVCTDLVFKTHIFLKKHMTAISVFCPV